MIIGCQGPKCLLCARSMSFFSFTFRVTLVDCKPSRAKAFPLTLRLGQENLPGTRAAGPCEVNYMSYHTEGCYGDASEQSPQRTTTRPVTSV